ETTGGSQFGMLISGDRPDTVLRHLHLRNVTVHDVAGTPSSKTSGLIVFVTAAAAARPAGAGRWGAAGGARAARRGRACGGGARDHAVDWYQRDRRHLVESDER